MLLQIQVTELMTLLQKTFPEMDETKLKAGLFDLVLNYASQTPPKVQEVGLAVLPREPRFPEGAEEDKVLEVPIESPLVEESISWGQLATTAMHTPKAQPSFGVDDDESFVESTPVVKASPVGKVSKRSRTKKDEATIRELQDISTEEFLRKLTEQHDKKNVKVNGQFLELGVDSSSGSEQDEVFG